MKRYKVYIDGQEGTTGLKIYERFKGREDIELLRIDEDKRKDNEDRAKFINMSDYTFLCLPDKAAIEAVSFITNPNVKIIDASTAHRTNDDWAYGFPELSDSFREKIKNSNRVAVPGCYASGFISIVYPLIESGIMGKDYPVTCHAVSGYSGAGKKAIKVYESEEKTKEMFSPRQYALSGNHKHLPEMQKITGLEYMPCFNPIVDDYYQGMVVSVPIHTRCLSKKVTKNDIYEVLKKKYEKSNFISVLPANLENNEENPFLAANTMAGSNKMQIFVLGNDDRVLIASRFDNLGKGASGAAVQCMNIMMGIDETTGLI